MFNKETYLHLRFGASKFPRWKLILRLESQLIQRWTLGNLSHVDVLLPDGNLLGARADGVHIREHNYRQFTNVTIMSIPATRSQQRKFYNFIFEQLGKPYDNWALLSFIFNRNWNDETKWTCSELPTRALIIAEILPELYMPSYKLTPVSLAILVSAIPGVLIEKENP